MIRLAMLLLAAAALTGCAPTARNVRESEAVIAENRSTTLTCAAADRCAIASPFHALIDATVRDVSGPGDNAASAPAATSTPTDTTTLAPTTVTGTSPPATPRHYVGLLERGEESLVWRIHLIRAARRSIDLQTFIFSNDQSGYLVLDELLAAARRGVRVRVLTDQLFSTGDTRLLALLAAAHVNFELRLYNPVFHKARTHVGDMVVGLACCFRSFNQRMHNKIMVIDGAVGMTGGRNVDDRYFDWSDTFNYRDRDVWVAGPVARAMQASFDRYWQHKTAVRLPGLRDVGRSIRRDGHDEVRMPDDVAASPRVAHVRELAVDAAWIARTFIDTAFPVGRVEFFADVPDKSGSQRYDRDLTARIGTLIGAARRNIVLQTPYLVISKGARKQLEAQRRAHPELRIEVSTNSLAATDAFYVYAISHKYKRRYLKRLHFEIYEYKPFPGRGIPEIKPLSLSGADLPPDAAFGGSGSIGGTGSVAGSRGDAGHRPRDRETRGSRLTRPAPLTRPGVRRGMHAKSIVIDGEVAMIGSHNFDPRSDKLNTEAGVIIFDTAVAQALERYIRVDIQPENAWVIARRERIPVVSGVSGAIERISERLPVFDLWPIRYATSFELKPECQPMSPFAANFHDCHVPVGDFPLVNLSIKDIYTRLITAFGAGLTPVL